MATERLDQITSFNYVDDVSAPRNGADFLKDNAAPKIIKEAPVDHLGVPKPIIPSEDFVRSSRVESGLSRHHEFFLYGQKQFTLPGPEAIRVSRILLTERQVHDQGRKSYHRFFNQSEGPQNEQGQFNVAVLSLAGYIPTEGVDLWSGEPVIRTLEKGERAILATVNPNHEDRYLNLYYYMGKIRPFLENYVKRQDFSLADNDAVNEFMSDSRISQVREAGYEVLRGAVRRAVEPIETDYVLAKESGLLHPQSPVLPETVVLNALGKRNQITDDYLHTLWQNLSNKRSQSESLDQESIAA